MTTGALPEAKPAKDVYGLFAGGTLCSEAEQILEAMAVPHTLIDLGADEYTRGRAHPIIDPRLRNSMLADLGGREDIAVILLDVMLGDLAHPDPAGNLIPAIETMRQHSIHPPAVIAVLVGTRFDPQGLERQRALLAQAGVNVFVSNAEAALAAGSLAGGLA